jgi:hypothetical protein
MLRPAWSDLLPNGLKPTLAEAGFDVFAAAFLYVHPDEYRPEGRRALTFR